MTFANLVATTAATTVAAAGNASAPYGVLVKNDPSNVADCVLRVCPAAISASIATQGWPLSRGQETTVTPYQCADANGMPSANMVWIYASTTGQTANVRY